MSPDNLRPTATQEQAHPAHPEDDFSEDWGDLLAELGDTPVTAHGLMQAAEIGALASDATARIGVRLEDLARVHPYSNAGPTGDPDIAHAPKEIDTDLISTLYNETPVCDLYIPSAAKDAEVLASTHVDPSGAITPLASVRRRIAEIMRGRGFPENKIDDTTLAATELIDNVKENVRPDGDSNHVGRFVCTMLTNRATGEAMVFAQTFNGSTTIQKDEKAEGQSGRGLGIITETTDHAGTYFITPEGYTAPLGDVMCIPETRTGLRAVWFAVSHNQTPTATEPTYGTVRHIDA